MPVAQKIMDSIERSSWIRKMFEQGLQLKARFGPENVFDFSLGNPDLDPPIEFFDALKECIQSDKKGAHGYMPNAGFADVRKALAQKVSREQKIDISSDFIITSCGAAGGLNVVFKTILNPGEQVIVPKPYFVEYGAYVGNHQGEMVLADTRDDFSLDINAIENALNEKTRAVLINSPNNPTGRVYTEDEIKNLAAVMDEYTARTGRIIYLVSDEPYRDIVYDSVDVPSILKNFSQSIVITSYSKTLSIPGERIGHIAVNPACEDAEQLVEGMILCTRILGFVNAPALMQRVVAGLTDVTVNVNFYRKRRDLLMDGLAHAGYDFLKPEGAFYLFCRSPIEDDVEFVKHLQKYNILVVPGTGFGGPGYFRIAYCVSENVIQRSIPKFREAVESL